MAILSKEHISRAITWLIRVTDRIYATQVKEFIPHGFRSHVFIMRMMGMWPTADNDSPRYKWLTIAAFLIAGILYPLSLLVNIVFINRFAEAMDYLFIALACWVATFKAGVIYWRRDIIRELFRIHVSLMSDARQNTMEINERIVRMNVCAHVAQTALYLLSWILFVVEVVTLAPGDGIYPSTWKWPYAFAQQRAIYLIVLVSQMMCDYGVSIYLALTDTLSMALINEICGHLEQLKANLRVLGAHDRSDDGRDTEFYKGLLECCRKYEQCLRCDFVLSAIHSIIH